MIISEHCILLAQSNQYIFRWGSSPPADLQKKLMIKVDLDFISRKRKIAE
jgi:hypothetical protein